MTTDALTTSIASLQPGVARPPGATAAKDQFGTDTFLQLLVAQLKYQNPTSPSDGTQFLAQTAQFSMVEKLNQLTQQTAQLLTGSALLGATGLIGKSIAWTDADGAPHSGTVSAARLGTDGPLLTVGAEQVPLSAVREVGQTPPTT